jgi:hypothetical protein
MGFYLVFLCFLIFVFDSSSNLLVGGVLIQNRNQGTSGFIHTRCHFNMTDETLAVAEEQLQDQEVIAVPEKQVYPINSKLLVAAEVGNALVTSFEG